MAVRPAQASASAGTSNAQQEEDPPLSEKLAEISRIADEAIRKAERQREQNAIFQERIKASIADAAGIKNSITSF